VLGKAAARRRRRADHGRPRSGDALSSPTRWSRSRRCCRTRACCWAARQTAAELRQNGSTSRFVHIATHGLFRRNNPLFSSIRLGDGQLCAYELYELHPARRARHVERLAAPASASLRAGTNSLDSCGPAVAGARAVLLTVVGRQRQQHERVHESVLLRLHDGWGKARAAQQAMQELRERYPHPFYWAPFALIGNVDAS